MFQQQAKPLSKRQAENIAKRDERREQRPRLVCVVDGQRVEVVVCIAGEALEEIKQRWPDGVDVDEIAKPDFESKLPRGERNWLARTARMLAKKAKSA